MAYQQPRNPHAPCTTAPRRVASPYLNMKLPETECTETRGTGCATRESNEPSRIEALDPHNGVTVLVMSSESTALCSMQTCTRKAAAPGMHPATYHLNTWTPAERAE